MKNILRDLKKAITWHLPARKHYMQIPEDNWRHAEYNLHKEWVLNQCAKQH